MPGWESTSTSYPRVTSCRRIRYNQLRCSARFFNNVFAPGVVCRAARCHRCDVSREVLGSENGPTGRSTWEPTTSMDHWRCYHYLGCLWNFVFGLSMRPATSLGLHSAKLPQWWTPLSYHCSQCRHRPISRSVPHSGCLGVGDGGFITTDGNLFLCGKIGVSTPSVYKSHYSNLLSKFSVCGAGIARLAILPESLSSRDQTCRPDTSSILPDEAHLFIGSQTAPVIMDQ